MSGSPSADRLGQALSSYSLRPPAEGAADSGPPPVLQAPTDVSAAGVVLENARLGGVHSVASEGVASAGLPPQVGRLGWALYQDRCCKAPVAPAAERTRWAPALCLCHSATQLLVVQCFGCQGQPTCLRCLCRRWGRRWVSLCLHQRRPPTAWRPASRARPRVGADLLNKPSLAEGMSRKGILAAAAARFCGSLHGCCG